MIPYDVRLVHMIEYLGLSIAGSATVPIPYVSSRSYSNVWEQLAEKLMARRGASYSSWAYILHLKELARLSGVEGLIHWYHYSCRQYSVFSLKMKEEIEREMKIPVLLLEGDYCDFRSRGADTMTTKLETFAEIIKSKGQV
jgi:benzoyl-CoA reductase/2-hydroxyglutaryl-CoA dehydratase subunit BcrC/BadD/HgdB